MGTTNAFYGIILKFGQEVGMRDTFAQLIERVPEVILVIALLSCFFGYRLVRLGSAVVVFFLSSIAICELLRPTADMGTIVTTFAVVGLIAAFLAYHWFKLSVFIFSAVMGYSIAAAFNANIWFCFGAAIVLGVLSLPFHSFVITVSTAVWGGYTLGYSGLSVLGVHIPLYKFVVAAVLVVAGLYTQFTMNRMSVISGKGLNLGRNAADKLT